MSSLKHIYLSVPLGRPVLKTPAQTGLLGTLDKSIPEPIYMLHVCAHACTDTVKHLLLQTQQYFTMFQAPKTTILRQRPHLQSTVRAHTLGCKRGEPPVPPTTRQGCRTRFCLPKLDFGSCVKHCEDPKAATQICSSSGSKWAPCPQIPGCHTFHLSIQETDPDLSLIIQSVSTWQYTLLFKDSQYVSSLSYPSSSGYILQLSDFWMKRLSLWSPTVESDAAWFTAWLEIQSCFAPIK